MSNVVSVQSNRVEEDFIANVLDYYGPGGLWSDALASTPMSEAEAREGLRLLRRCPPCPVHGVDGCGWMGGDTDDREAVACIVGATRGEPLPAVGWGPCLDRVRAAMRSQTH